MQAERDCQRSQCPAGKEGRAEDWSSNGRPKAAGWVSRLLAFVLFRDEQAAGLAYQVDAAADDDGAPLRRQTASLCNRFSDRAGRGMGNSGGLCGSGEVGGLCGARRVDRRKHHIVEDGKKYLRHLAQRLVAKAGKDQHVLAPLVLLTRNRRLDSRRTERSPKRPRARRIMSYIEKKPGAVGQGNPLQTPGPSRVVDSSLDGLSSDQKTVLRAKFNGGGNRKGDVAVLMRSFERRVDDDRLSKNLEPIRVGGACVHGRNVFRRADAPHTQLCRHFTQSLIGLRMLWQGHQRPIRAQDAGLLPSDQVDRRTQPFLVIQRN